MRLLVIGATGGTGRRLLHQASARGHHVVAFAREPEKLRSCPPGTVAIPGDPRNAAQLQDAMRDCDAVLSVLGPPLPPRAWPRPTTILAEGAHATVAAMKQAGLARLLIVSGELCFTAPGAPVVLLRATLLRHLARDQATMERVVRASDLDWTIARPTRLTKGPLTSIYRAEVEQRPRSARPISRADVADFLLRAVESGTYIKQTVGLAR